MIQSQLKWDSNAEIPIWFEDFHQPRDDYEDVIVTVPRSGAERGFKIVTLREEGKKWKNSVQSNEKVIIRI